MAKWFDRWMQEKRRRQKLALPDIVPGRTMAYW